MNVLLKQKISLFGDFPRIVGYPIKTEIMWDLEQLNNYISKNVGKYDVHLSLYSYNITTGTNDIHDVDYYSAIVDKVFFDCDEGLDWLEQMKRVDYWCTKHDILRRYSLSSNKGGHIFIGCNKRIQYKKTALRNFQMYLTNKLKLKIDKGISVFGDIARSFRVPNTYNFKRSTYCVPITSEELKSLTLDEVDILTREPRDINKNLWAGQNIVNLTPFDKQEFMYDIQKTESNVNVSDLLTKEQLNNLNIPFDKFPDCIKEFLKDSNLGYNKRHLLVLFLRDQTIRPLTDIEIVSILKNTLNNELWTHVSTKKRLAGHNPGENLMPVKLTLSNLGYKFPSCKQMCERKLCPSRKICTRWHPIFGNK